VRGANYITNDANGQYCTPWAHNHSHSARTGRRLSAFSTQEQIDETVKPLAKFCRGHDFKGMIFLAVECENGLLSHTDINNVSKGVAPHSMVRGG
jgi:hypothetical protein